MLFQEKVLYIYECKNDKKLWLQKAEDKAFSWVGLPLMFWYILCEIFSELLGLGSCSLLILHVFVTCQEPLVSPWVHPDVRPPLSWNPTIQAPAQWPICFGVMVSNNTSFLCFICCFNIPFPPPCAQKLLSIRSTCLQIILQWARYLPLHQRHVLLHTLYFLPHIHGKAQRIS